MSKASLPRQSTLWQALNQGLPYEPASTADSLYSDYVVYIDESGDHGLAHINPEYTLRPTQKNRAFTLLKRKYLCRDGRTQSGAENYGLTVVPAPKNERPR